MTSAPAWLASPPEVHSALLSSGPGPGPLLQAAAAWSALGAEYTATATELTELLGSVQAGAWAGPTAQRYAAAHGPYLHWLTESAAGSAFAAAAHQTAAGAYTAALATMPTLAELAANHATHAALVATNFFGVNTIPITLNEADYVRMWIQAGETMTVYQSVAGAALAAVPASTPAPPIVAPDSASAAGSGWDQQVAGWLTQYNMGFADPIAKWLWAQLGVDGYPIQAMPFATAVGQMLMHIPGMSPILATALGWSTFHTLMLVWPLGQLAVQLVIPIVVAAAPTLAAAAGAAGLSGLAGLSGVGVDGDAKLPAAPQLPVPAGVPVSGVPAAAGAPAGGVPAGQISTPGAPSPLPVQPMADCGGPTPCPPDCSCGPTTGMTDGFYLVSSASTAARQRTGSRRSSELRDEIPDDIAAAAAAAAGGSIEQRRRGRRHRGATEQGRSYRHEFIGSGPVASDSGSGPLGFAGVADKPGLGAAVGLATLQTEEFTGRTSTPMLPTGWAENATTVGRG